MFQLRPLRLPFLLLVAILTPGIGHSAIQIVAIGKEYSFSQAGPSLDDLVPDFEPYHASVEAEVDSQSDLSNFTFGPQGGTAITVPWDSDYEGYSIYEVFSTKAAMDAAYPAGNYVVAFTPAGGSRISKVLTVTDELPNPPVIENWFDLQHYPVDQDLTLRWSAMIGGAAKDVINVEVADTEFWNRVFETGIHYFQMPNSLDGTASSVVIPAGTLEAGRAYEVIVGFNKVDSIDVGQTLPDVLMGAVNYAETRAQIRTVTRHPSTVITSGVLARFQNFRQTGPSAVNPIGDGTFATAVSTIRLGNPDDLTGVTVTNNAGQFSLSKSAENSIWRHVRTDPADVSWVLSDGDNRIDYTFAAGGAHSTTLNLVDRALVPVTVTNWSELQAASAGAVTPIRWTIPAGAHARDSFVVRIAKEDGTIVFETESRLTSGSGLDGTKSSVDVPAGTLETGTIYNARINFLKFSDIDQNSQAGAVFAAGIGVSTLFTINTGAASADPVRLVGVGRITAFRQSGPGAPVLDAAHPEQFSSIAVLLGDSFIGLSSASVTLPGGEERSLAFSADDNQWESIRVNENFAALLADFPAGDYDVRYQVGAGSPVEVTATLGDTFPSAPQIINWTEAQSILASRDFTLKWLPIEPLTADDAISIWIEGPEGEVFSTPLRLLDPAGMDGTAVSVTIPADTLLPGRTYDVDLEAIRVTNLDASNPERPVVGFNLRTTSFNLVTTSGNRPPDILTDSIGSATEGQAFSVAITASDPEDGAAVSFSAPVLPSWLALADQGDGSAILSGMPTPANVGTFTVRVAASDVQGLTSSREYELNVGPDLSDPEGRALDISSISWQKDGTAPFLVQITDVQKGESALTTGAVGNGVASSLQASFTGPLKLSFHWKVSSEAGKDFFRVRVDGVSEAEISGEQNWREQIIDVPAGAHTVRWAYEKDGAGSAGADRGWLDHVTILPPEAGVFSGTYLGEIKSSTGTVSLFIRPNNTAVFLGYHPESGKGLSNFEFTLSDSGTFSFEVVNPDDMNANYTVTGSVSNGVATGSVSGLDLTFTANLISGGGQVVSYDGYYQNALTSTTSGLVYLIVATDGQAYFFAQDLGYVEGYITTIDALGNIVLQTSKGFDYALQVDPTTDIVAGTFTPPGGQPSNILGIREGSPGDELLANISTRGKVQTGGKIMIASFVISGTGSKQLLIRAIGPKLGDFGLQGVLQDPVINLVRLGEQAPMRTNDDWGDDGQTTRIIADSIRLGAFPLNAGSRDAVMAVSLEPGAYTAKIRGNGSLTGVSLVEVYDADDPTVRLPTSDVVNIATRGEAGTGPDALIAGFVVSGDVPKRVLLRGIGPQLTEFGVAGALADPKIDLTNAAKELVATNDDWGDSPDLAAVVASMKEVGAFDLLEGSKDAALLIWLDPGAYTAKVTGVGGGTGVALIEVYDN